MNEAREYKFLLLVMGAAVPIRHQRELEDIINHKSGSWIEKAEQIKYLIIRCFKQDTTSTPWFKEVRMIDMWANKRIQDFYDRMAPYYRYKEALTVLCIGTVRTDMLPLEVWRMIAKKVYEK